MDWILLKWQVFLKWIENDRNPTSRCICITFLGGDKEWIKYDMNENEVNEDSKVEVADPVERSP